MGQYERLKEEKRDARYTEWAKVPKASSQDWPAYRSRGKAIGAYYRNRGRKERGERLYEERYLR